ncbi:hypothetical protein A3F65_00890 [Candidatus Saccharibacteria bacterium RIFCSPHIGHO2_12_FULL_47_16b]|nr:MAG: hypothetical protein A3F65_00890 [Candidatus Saccharibacteria bacterium RIFCSPHIGHO2_12_FULL_47_16b]
MKTVIFDWKQTLYDPENKSLIDGALEVLNFLKNKKVPTVLVGKGAQDMHKEVKRLGVKDYFLHINFREGPKDPSLYSSFVKRHAPQKSIFVGDRVRSELAVGNSLGATTIWVRHGEFANEEPENPMEQPDYSVNSLQELISIIEKV